jgi:hypothetical protein
MYAYRWHAALAQAAGRHRLQAVTPTFCMLAWAVTAPDSVTCVGEKQRERDAA